MIEPEEKEPSGGRATLVALAAHRNPGPSPFPVCFDRHELNAILAVYGRHVADGEWRDYAIDHRRDEAVFSIFRRTSEMPLFRIFKQPKLARRQGAYSLVAPTGMVLKRGHDIANVLRFLDRPLRVVARLRALPPGLLAGAGPKRPLHQHGVEPFAELVARILQRPGEREPGRLVEVDRGDVVAVADERDHLAKIARGRFVDQFAQELPADALPARFRRQIDRILDRVVIGRAVAKRPAIGVAEDAILPDGDEIGIARGRPALRRRAAISCSSGGTISNVAVPVSTTSA